MCLYKISNKVHRYVFVIFVSQWSKKRNALCAVIFHFALNCAIKEDQGNKKLLEMNNLNQVLVYTKES
jgi:hypothetical protein